MKAGLDKATFIAKLEELLKMTRIEADHRKHRSYYLKESEERRAHRDARRISNG